jgi:hypothetical protein
MRVMSCVGPVGPITIGVWHSLQAKIVTRYFPRSSADGAAAAVAAAALAVP